MKAQKAVGGVLHLRNTVLGAVAGLIAISSAAALGMRSRAEDDPDTDSVAITVETVAADTGGAFTATVWLDELPDTGLCAMDFAIAYDPAVLTISDVELLYDTGAEAAEVLVNPDFAGTVFTYEDIGGELRIRWATGLRIRDYWLTEERAFFTISGQCSEQALQAAQATLGSCVPLNIIPATRETYDGSGVINTVIVAGYLDDQGNSHNCETKCKDGGVWLPINETGATMYGDIDLDGQLTLSDAVLLHRALAEQTALCAAGYANADCEFDGVLSIADVTLMLRVLKGEQEASTLGAH